MYKKHKEFIENNPCTVSYEFNLEITKAISTINYSRTYKNRPIDIVQTEDDYVCICSNEFKNIHLRIGLLDLIECSFDINTVNNIVFIYSFMYLGTDTVSTQSEVHLRGTNEFN